MRGYNHIKAILIIVICLQFSFSKAQNWTAIKDTTMPFVALSSEFDNAYKQPLANLGWEDGVHISQDGRNLYCTFVPIDFLSFVLNSGLPNNFSSDYLRGAPTFGMDLTTNPIGAEEWLHSDILYSYRESISEPFTQWELSNMARPFYSEGAPTPSFSGNTTIEFMAFTSNDNSTNNSDIWILENTTSNPSGIGSPMPSPVNSSYHEDNPHVIRLDNNNLVLFFDSNNLPGGEGDIDIWYSTSSDNGASWSTPANVSSINTNSKEHQPFLHFDKYNDQWYLYYSAYHSDGKLAIFRTVQKTVNNWNNWGVPELVISAGNSAGIGEPTVTSNGDISFVLVYQDPEQTSSFDRFDSDPWFLPKKSITTALKKNIPLGSINIFPNPCTNYLTIKAEDNQGITKVELFNLQGKLVYKNDSFTTDEINLNTANLNQGMYMVKVYGSKRIQYKQIVKK